MSVLTDRIQNEIEDKIEDLLNRLNVATIHTQYNYIVRDNMAVDEKQFNIECLDILQAEGLIKIENIANMGGNNFISLTSKGKEVIVNGGYKRYLIQKKEKEQLEIEAHEIAKQGNVHAYKIKIWTVRTFWVSVIAALTGIALVAFAINDIIGKKEIKTQQPVDTVQPKKLPLIEKQSSSVPKDTSSPSHQILVPSSHLVKKDSLPLHKQK
jgi:hypothetical protein